MQSTVNARYTSKIVSTTRLRIYSWHNLPPLILIAASDNHCPNVDDGLVEVVDVICDTTTERASREGESARISCRIIDDRRSGSGGGACFA